MSQLVLFGKEYSLNNDLASLIKQAVESDNTFVKSLMSLALTAADSSSFSDLAKSSDESSDSSNSKSDSNDDESYNTIYPEEGVNVYFKLSNSKMGYLSRFSIELVAQAIVLNSNSILPFLIIKDPLEALPLWEGKLYYTDDTIEWKYLDLKIDNEILEYNSVTLDGKRKAKLDIDIPHCDLIVSLLQETGAVICGSVLLKSFGKRPRPNCFYIESMTLDFLRLFLEKTPSSQQSIDFLREKNYDEYIIKFDDGFTLHYMHNAFDKHAEDIKLSAEENREMTLDKIKKSSSWLSDATSYDGEYFYFNWKAVFSE